MAKKQDDMTQEEFDKIMNGGQAAKPEAAGLVPLATANDQATMNDDQLDAAEKHPELAKGLRRAVQAW